MAGSLGKMPTALVRCVFRGHPASDSESIRPLIPEHPATL